MSKSTETGLAMVIVVWVLSLLTIMAGSFALTMRRETTVISAVKDNAEVLAVAETGLAFAKKMLLLEDEAKRWRADGSVYRLPYPDAEIRLRILSEQGKVDINQADEVLLTAIMSATSAEMDQQQQIVSAILDWRDEDDLVHINGAEKEEYLEAGRTYIPTNQAFSNVDELQMILGMDANIFKQLKLMVTVYAGLPQVNLQEASKEVLQAVSDISNADLEEYLQQRIDNARQQMPAPQFPGINQAEGKTPNNNTVYTVISQARLNDDKQAAVRVIIKRAANKQQASQFEILDWEPLYEKGMLFSDEIEPLLVTGYDESEYNH